MAILQRVYLRRRLILFILLTLIGSYICHIHPAKHNKHVVYLVLIYP